MDIVDIILARAKSFTGETKTLIQQAQNAMEKANEVATILQDAQDANAAAQTANANAQAANEAAQASAAAYDDIVNDINDAAENIINEKIAEVTDGLAVVDEAVIDTLGDNINSDFALTKNITHRNDAMETDITLNLIGEDTTTAHGVVKNYTTYGDNEDGSMTQKAIKNYVENAVRNSGGSGSGGNTNLGGDNAGSVVVVGPDGNIIAGDTSEQSLIEVLIRTGVYQAKNAVGASIDYENKNISRTQEATVNTDFNNYIMYSGRRRCNVNDDGIIVAFYGDANYKEDGSNGQVMVYQPKFYYQRIPINTTNSTVGKIIRKESLIISATKQSGFKLHPAFIDENGDELEYILISAYEGCAYDTSAGNYIKDDAAGVDFAADKLSSIAEAKPLSGEKNQLTIANAEKLAQNRGNRWHITSIKACSVDQMLALVEYGTFNIQNAIESGVSYLENSYVVNRACITGSTAALGNSSGAATRSSNIINGSTNTYGEAGKRSISYRGEENPFGNIWKFVGDVNIFGDGSMQGGVPYICKNYNYSASITADYESVGINLPNTSDWVSGMGYGDEKYDWLFIPAEASNANSATPIGDYIWITKDVNKIQSMSFGGDWLFTTKNGMFFYACDRDTGYAASTFGARLVYMPLKNSVHDTNYALWRNHIGG